jgi:hypothetical protein
VLNRFIKTGIAFCLLLNFAFVTKAQNNQNNQSNQNNPNKKQDDKQKQDPKNATFTAEQLADLAIFATAGFGGREALKQIRGKGIERGKYRRPGANGAMEEFSYERRFIRGEDMYKDRIRIDQKSPTIAYALIFSEGNIWGIINKTIFTPRQDIARAFNHQLWYSMESLLRYKENGSTLRLVGKDKQMGVDLHVLELTDKEKHKMRFYISAKLFRVLWLEYEEPLTENGMPVKYMRRFYNYRVAQGTLVPFRTVFYENGQQVEETEISTVTYGVKIDDLLFDNPNLQKKTNP